MIRVNKLLARKMYNVGCTVVVVPCNCGADNQVARAELSVFNADKDLLNKFDFLVDEFVYYNCNNETGQYVHFYVSEKDLEAHNMCQKMCK